MLVVVPAWNIRTSAKWAVRSFLILMPLLVYESLESAVPSSPQGALSYTLDKFELTLNNDHKHCQLQVKNQSVDSSKAIPLLLKAPCYWVVSDKTKDLLHYDYEAVEVANTLLVAGTPLDWSAEKKTYQKLPNDTFCSQYLQGVIISKNDVFAVDEKMIAAHCETGLAMDEKIFYAMAHNPKRYQEKSLEAIEAALEIPSVITTSSVDKQPEDSKEKSFIDSVTDSIKAIFSSETEGTK